MELVSGTKRRKTNSGKRGNGLRRIPERKPFLDVHGKKMPVIEEYVVESLVVHPSEPYSVFRARYRTKYVVKICHREIPISSQIPRKDCSIPKISETRREPERSEDDGWAAGDWSREKTGVGVGGSAASFTPPNAERGLIKKTASFAAFCVCESRSCRRRTTTFPENFLEGKSLLFHIPLCGNTLISWKFTCTNCFGKNPDYLKKKKKKKSVY
ncbi:hypothetical protein CEXT_262481 [Caerostris extrusa]|uniref:Uncharacterized protein n=1 Tax=Caerostris extrusa TaxID=172846 RepID=A0AAV4R532_CAEEX|nr:hypothetical protein CEXT_262481 [Caerostris extrusa]